MRPSYNLLSLVLVLVMLGSSLSYSVLTMRRGQADRFAILRSVTADLGLSDLAVSTEARYTRHPAVSDSVVVTMDHPGAIDHFPSTFFWAPVRRFHDRK